MTFETIFDNFDNFGPAPNKRVGQWGPSQFSLQSAPSGQQTSVQHGHLDYISTIQVLWRAGIAGIWTAGTPTTEYILCITNK